MRVVEKIERSRGKGREKAVRRERESKKKGERKRGEGRKKARKRERESEEKGERQEQILS